MAKRRQIWVNVGVRLTNGRYQRHREQSVVLRLALWHYHVTVPFISWEVFMYAALKAVPMFDSAPLLVSIVSFSCHLLFSTSPYNFSHHVSQLDCVSAGRHTEKNNSSGAGINLNSLTPLNQPMVRFFYCIMADPAGACPTSSPGLWHQYRKHFKGKAFWVTEGDTEWERRQRRGREISGRIRSTAGRGTFDSKDKGWESICHLFWHAQ